ncbi:hypothetical protein EQO05_00955 [Methanosarcina sp. MSH10X1]|uniref:hypothetical protein n=1 Tax=Methanosarcina sp. MSH10X1 TaxID=2507075 RepID=UPI000FFBE376|nr:hypothetical protein [Methanosarcina sp. MSH10X1]RXA21837.1 hypothetical protein EQO05_00955 [Methanosarcina sp. MSH10X1]
MSGGALVEIQDYAVAVISVAILYIVGGVILDNIIGVGLLSNTSAFYGTIASVESMWNSSLGIISAVVIIAAAVIIMRQLKSFNN